MKSRTIYWRVRTNDGIEHKGVKVNAVCTLSFYSGVLKRKFRDIGWKEISVSIEKQN